MKSGKQSFKKMNSSGGGKRIAIKITTLATSVLIILASFTYLNSVQGAAEETVDIVRAKVDINQYSLLEKSYFEKYSILQSDYNSKEMILYEDFDDVVTGKLAANYIRHNTVLYEDQLTDVKPPPHIYLYDLPEGHEVLTLPYKSAEAAGDILRPGDMIRIRITYEVEETAQNDAYDDNPNGYYSSRSSNSKKVLKTDLLFDTIIVMDMLNSKGQSVYEVYAEVLLLPDKDREIAMKNKDFLSSIKP